MTLQELQELAQWDPSRVVRRDWSLIEARIGCSLPQDFKDVVDSFGLGQWREWLIPFGPQFLPDCYDINIAPWEMIEGEVSFLKSLTSEERAADFPFDYFPENNGLFPFATTVQADRLCWQMSGKPNEWPMVVCASRDTAYRVYQMSFTDFLAAFLLGKLGCELFPDFDESKPIFEAFAGS
ncbi:MAG: SMI1/KNR4 family protein [Fimbriiglobus sp.]